VTENVAKSAHQNTMSSHKNTKDCTIYDKCLKKQQEEEEGVTQDVMVRLLIEEHN